MGWPRLAALLGAAAWAACWPPPPARAQAALVTTVVDPCVPVDPLQLDRLLGIELGTSASATHASGATGPTHVSVGCVASGIELHLVDALTRKEMVRVLSRESFTDASSTRLLALAIAEFVVASWVELRLPQKVEPAGPAPSTSTRRAATEALQRKVPEAEREDPALTEVALTGALQTWSAKGSLFYGAALRLVHAPSSAFAFSIGADLGMASEDTSFGSVLVRTTSVSLAGLVRVPLLPVVLSTGPGGRMGLAQLGGTLDDGAMARLRAAYLPYGGLFWLGRAALMLGAAVSIVLDAELGAATLPVRAAVGVREVIAIEGVWLSLGLGLGVEL